jgi:hypothetical protein
MPAMKRRDMKPLLALIAIALAGCVETGDRKMEGGARDDELLPRIDALLQVDLFDRAEFAVREPEQVVLDVAETAQHFARRHFAFEFHPLGAAGESQLQAAVRDAPVAENEPEVRRRAVVMMQWQGKTLQ